MLCLSCLGAVGMRPRFCLPCHPFSSLLALPRTAALLSYVPDKTLRMCKNVMIFGFTYVDRGLFFLALVSLTIKNTAPITAPWLFTYCFILTGTRELSKDWDLLL